MAGDKGVNGSAATHFLPESRSPSVWFNGAEYKIETEKQLKIIPGATHLFEEPGALEEVARLAAEWFKKYLIA